MPGYKYKYSDSTSDNMLSIMNNKPDIITYKRAQCIYLRSKHEYSPKKISDITHLSISRVNDIHSLYHKHGEKIVYCGKRGGRNNANMTIDQEEEFIKKYEDLSNEGTITTIAKIYQDLEKHLAKKLHKSGIYKILHRNNWRKISPRPQHSNHDQEAIET